MAAVKPQSTTGLRADTGLVRLDAWEDVKHTSGFDRGDGGKAWRLADDIRILVRPRITAYARPHPCATGHL